MKPMPAPTRSIAPRAAPRTTRGERAAFSGGGTADWLSGPPVAIRPTPLGVPLSVDCDSGPEVASVAARIEAGCGVKRGSSGEGVPERDGMLSDGGRGPGIRSADPCSGATIRTDTGPVAGLMVATENGAGVNGYAAAAKNFFGLAGYPNATADTAAAQVQTTTVYYAPGYEGDAQAIATLLSIAAPQPLPVGTNLGKTAEVTPADTGVVVVLGPDVQGIITPAGAGTTTTVAGAGATTTTVAAGGASTIPTTTTKG